MEKRVYKCCNSCAFLACNKDKPTPPGSPLDWFSQTNLDRIWREVSYNGEFLLCHSTDPEASEYGGADGIVPGKETACTGFTLLIFMHYKIYEKFMDYRKYRNAVGHKVAMTKEALGEAAFCIALGRSHLMGGMKIPQSLHDNRPMVYPTGFERAVKLFEEIMGKEKFTADGKN